MTWKRLSYQIVKVNKDGQGDTLKGLVDKKSIKNKANMKLA